MDEELKKINNNIIVLSITVILSIGLLLTSINNKKRYLHQKSLTFYEEKEIIYLIRIAYIFIAYYFFYNTYKNLQEEKEKNENFKEIERLEKLAIVTFLILIASLINVTITNPNDLIPDPY